MKVSSPVGTFPFEADSIHFAEGRLELKGHMGAWPAKVALEPRDALSLARLTPPRLVLSLAAAALAGAALRRRRHGR